jgi:AraC-like DNA-binding protein
MATMLASAGRIVHRLLQRNGLNADALFLECRLDPLKLTDPRARYPISRNLALWRLADERIQDPCWGLMAGEVWRQTDFGALGCSFLAARTLESALMRLVRYFRIVTAEVDLRVETDGDCFNITCARPAPEADIAPLQDARWSIILRLCREAYGPDLPLREVRLTHPRGACDYAACFGGPVRFDAPRSGLTLPLAVVRRPLAMVNRDLAQASERLLSDFDRPAGDTSITSRVRQLVRDGLSSGTVSTKEVAYGLALAPRTLQRRLQEEGTTFAEVTDSVRKELAQQSVRSGEHDLNETTYLTGFANLTAFYRAYKVWTGHTPTEDRRRARDERSAPQNGATR